MTNYPKYPTDFKNSSSNSKVSNENVQKYIDKALDDLKANGERQYISFMGDTMIFVSRMHEEDGGGFEIIVSNNFNQAYVGNVVFNRK